MVYALMVSAAVAVVLLVLLALLRGKAVAAKPLSGKQAAVIVGLVVLVAAGVDGFLLVRQSRAAKTAGGPPGGGMGMMGGGMGGPGGGMGGPGGGMGGQREPSPKRDLSRFVRKLALFQAQGQGALEPSQVVAILPALTAMQGAERMTEDEGGAQLEALRAILTEAQRAAVDAIELPRPQGGMGGPGMGGPGAGGVSGGGPAAPGPGAAAEGPPATPSPDRGQAFRERLLTVPYVKQQYDAKVAEDGTLATDQEKQREFFRGVMRELSPFQQGSGKESLDGLVKALQGAGVTPPRAP